MYIYIYTYAYGVGGLRKGYQATALVTYLSGFVLFGCKLDAHMLDFFLSSWFSCWWKGLRHQKLFLFTRMAVASLNEKKALTPTGHPSRRDHG